MLEVFFAVAAAFFVSSSDGSRLIASCFCGLMPLILALIEAKGDPKNENKEGILSLWTIFSVLFVLDFVSAMVCVRINVTARDLESLLVDSMSLLCTGVTSAHAVLYWLYLSPKPGHVAIEQCSALLFYLMLLCGVEPTELLFAFHLAMCPMMLTTQGHTVFCTYIAVLLAYRMEELFWCDPPHPKCIPLTIHSCSAS